MMCLTLLAVKWMGEYYARQIRGKYQTFARLKQQRPQAVATKPFQIKQSYLLNQSASQMTLSCAQTFVLGANHSAFNNGWRYDQVPYVPQLIDYTCGYSVLLSFSMFNYAKFKEPSVHSHLSMPVYMCILVTILSLWYQAFYNLEKWLRLGFKS